MKANTTNLHVVKDDRQTAARYNLVLRVDGCEDEILATDLRYEDAHAMSTGERGMRLLWNRDERLRREARQAKRQARLRTVEYRVTYGEGDGTIVAVEVDMKSGAGADWSAGLNRGMRAALAQALRESSKELHSIEFWQVKDK
jgi:hypothetical protein